MLSKISLWIRGIKKAVMDEYRLLRQASFKRAGEDTLQYVCSWKGKLLEIVSTGAFAGLATLIISSDNKYAKAITGGIGAIIGLAIPFVLVFICLFIYSPAKQRNEARTILSKMLNKQVEIDLVFDQIEKQMLYLKVRSIGDQQITCYAKMLCVKYINEGKSQEFDCPYEILWEKNTTQGEAKLKTIAPPDNASLKVAKIDASIATGRDDKNFGDGARILLWRTDQLPTQLVLDFDTIIEFQIRIFVSHLRSEAFDRNLKLKVHRDESLEGEPIKNPYWVKADIADTERHNNDTR